MPNRNLIILLSFFLISSGCAKNFFEAEPPPPAVYRGYFEVNKKRYEIVKIFGIDDEGYGRSNLTAEAAVAEDLGVPGAHSYCTINFKGGEPVTAQYPIVGEGDTLSSVKRRLYIQVYDVYSGYTFTSTHELAIKADVTIESEDKVIIKVPEIRAYRGLAFRADSVVFSCEIIKSE